MVLAQEHIGWVLSDVLVLAQPHEVFKSFLLFEEHFKFSSDHLLPKELTLSLVNPTNSAILRTMPGSMEIVTLNTPEEKRTAPSISRLCMGSVLLQSLCTMALDSSLQNDVTFNFFT